MNTRKLRQVRRLILEEPKRIYMNDWIISAADPFPPKLPPCGTAGCIAGWTVLSTRTPEAKEALLHPNYLVEDEAAHILNLDENQAWRLFMRDGWPKNFYRRLEAAKQGTKRYARVVSDRIEHFIKTKGAE